MNKQVVNSQTIKEKFTNKTSSVFITPTKDYSKAINNDIYNTPSEPSLLYLEKGDLSTDFSLLISNVSSPLKETVTLFGKSSPEIPILTPIYVNKPINIYICIYSLIETPNPFFEYLFDWNKETKEAEFPKIIINLQSPPNTDNDESALFIRNQIMNECIEYIGDLFNSHDMFNKEFLDEIFKGFILKSEPNSIFLFFNGSDFDYSNLFPIKESTEKKPTPPLLKKTILHEIVDKQHIGKIPVSPKIVELFKENQEIKTIYLKDKYNKLKNIPVVYPFCLYLCENDETLSEADSFNWKNISIDDISDDKTVDFPLLGDFYYFSNTPLKEESTKEEWKKDEYKKYAVFLNINNGEYPIEESYIVKDLTSITKDQLDSYFQKINPANVSTIWFKYNGLQLWAIKYPNQIICINSI